MADLLNHAPLARDLSGNVFNLPAEARGWRVRRRNQRGTLELVRVEGLPLQLPIDATFDDLADAVGGAAGQYRLDPVDEYGQLIPRYAAFTDIKGTTPYADDAAAIPLLLSTIERQAQSASQVAQSLGGQLVKALEVQNSLIQALVGRGAEIPRPAPPAAAPIAQAPPADGESLPWRDVVREMLPLAQQALSVFFLAQGGGAPAAAAPPPQLPGLSLPLLAQLVEGATTAPAAPAINVPPAPATPAAAPATTAATPPTTTPTTPETNR
jgi:hypothetical protein